MKPIPASLVEAVYFKPWLITGAAHAVLRQRVASLMAGHTVDIAGMEFDCPGMSIRDGIAIVPIKGAIGRGFTGFDQFSLVLGDAVDSEMVAQDLLEADDHEGVEDDRRDDRRRRRAVAGCGGAQHCAIRPEPPRRRPRNRSRRQAVRATAARHCTDRGRPAALRACQRRTVGGRLRHLIPNPLDLDTENNTLSVPANNPVGGATNPVGTFCGMCDLDSTIGCQNDSDCIANGVCSGQHTSGIDWLSMGKARSRRGRLGRARQ